MNASRVTLLALALILCAQGAAWAAPPGVCDLVKKRNGLSKYDVYVEEDGNGERVIAADIDGDGRPDRIGWFHYGSGSIIPADPSTITLALSSSGNTFTIEQQRLNVVRYQKKLFVIGGWLESEQGPWHVAVHSITPTGFKELCSFSGKGLGP